jgi:ankyrin repeat protein
MDTQDSALDGTDGRRVLSQLDEVLRQASHIPPEILPAHNRAAVDDDLLTSVKAMEIAENDIDLPSEDDLPPTYEEAARTGARPTTQNAAPPHPQIPQTGSLGDPVTPSISSSSSGPPPRLTTSTSNPRTTASESSSSATPTTPATDANPLDYSSLPISTLKQSFRAFTSRFSWFKVEPLTQALCEACRIGDVQQVAGLISEGANINARNEDGLTPLACTIATDQAAVASLLLHAGADLNAGGGWSHKLPPLFAAAHAGSVNVAALLMEKGAWATDKSIAGQPYFYDTVNTPGASLEGIRFLLERGAIPQSKNLSGRRAIVAAVKRERKDLVKLLLDYGARASTNDYTGTSILSVILDQPDSLEMASIFLKHGADPNSTNLTGDPALSTALSKRNVAFVKLLLEYGARANVKDYSGQPVIINTVRDQKLSDEDKYVLVKLLLEHGASPHTKDMSWDTPVIQHAMERATSDIVSLLMQHGADASGKRKGEPLIIYAVQSGKPGMVEALLTHGVSPNVVGSNGSTLLMNALMRVDMDLIRLLMKYGVEVDEGPREYALALGNQEVLGTLGIDAKMHYIPPTAPGAVPAVPASEPTEEPQAAAAPRPNRLQKRMTSKS